MPETNDAIRASLIRELSADRRLAHQVLFKHRHPHETPPFHLKMIDAWHSRAPYVEDMAFRGSGKSTIGEEAIIIQACFREFRNCIILGENENRSKDRLRSIKNELETNGYIEDLFGPQVGITWGEQKVVLANGVVIQAFGQGQGLRGVKHLDWRPDLGFVDDLENEDSVATPDARYKLATWFYSTFLPSFDPRFKLRMAATPLDPAALAVVLSKDPKWEVLKFPIMYADPATGQPTATWPERFPMSFIEDKQKELERAGLNHTFQREYMCEPEDPAKKPFKAEMFRISPMVRTWEAVYAMYDPARSVKTTSASTGVAVWSWIGNRLIIWDSYARMWKPDEMIADIFTVNETYNPVLVGVEEDGLNEWVMQPLRQEQLRRGTAVPLRALKAPKGKLDFIQSLQPFFMAHEIIFAKELPDLQQQLLSFPTGRIDAPNALAYALRLRPGQPVFENFTPREHVAEDLRPAQNAPCWLAVNAGGGHVSGVLFQLLDGSIRVFADFVREGDPGSQLASIAREAGTLSRGKLKLVAPQVHFQAYDTLGMRGAARLIPAELQQGGPLPTGRDELRAMMARLNRGLPAFQVSSEARWTLNALAGGYCRALNKQAVLSDEAEPGIYRTLMEGLEAFAALLRSGVGRDDESLTYETASNGRRFLSARATR